MLKFLIVAVLLAIVASLGSGLFFLLRDGSDSRRMVKALTLRITLSVALFVLLLIAWASGLIQPHGIVPA